MLAVAVSAGGGGGDSFSTTGRLGGGSGGRPSTVGPSWSRCVQTNSGNNSADTVGRLQASRDAVAALACDSELVFLGRESLSTSTYQQTQLHPKTGFENVIC